MNPEAEDHLLSRWTNSTISAPTKKPKSTCCLRSALASSIAINIGFAITGIYFFFITSQKFPNPPIPTPNINGSCPYAHNMSLVGDSVEFSAYEIGSNHIKFCWPLMPHAERDNAPYVLEVDDWFTHRSEFKTAYAGAANDFTLTNLLPGQPIQVRLNVNTHVLPGSKMKTSKTITLNTLNASYCGNPKDLTVLRNASHNDMPDKLQNCAFASNMVNCIEESLGFTAGCSKCFAGENSCIITNCVDKNKFVCLTAPKSIECKTCINDYCMGPTAKCAGIPLWALNQTSLPLTPS
jgi:hypothetical protein